MSKTIINILLGTLAALALNGCQQTQLTLTPVTDDFDC